MIAPFIDYTIRISINQILILDSGEGFTIEYKKNESKLSSDVFETVGSFSNRYGGHILLGVVEVEKNGRKVGEVAGVDKESIYDMKRDFINTLNNPTKFSPTLYLELEEFDYDGKTVLWTYVPPMSQICFCDKKVYDRIAESLVERCSSSAFSKEQSEVIVKAMRNYYERLVGRNKELLSKSSYVENENDSEKQYWGLRGVIPEEVKERMQSLFGRKPIGTASLTLKQSKEKLSTVYGAAMNKKQNPLKMNKKMVWRTASLHCRPTPYTIIIGLLFGNVKDFTIFRYNLHAFDTLGLFEVLTITFDGIVFRHSAKQDQNFEEVLQSCYA